jgi:4-amino-4-deoxy-L-arabinose transferase-like glycosyltransferase
VAKIPQSHPGSFPPPGGGNLSPQAAARKRSEYLLPAALVLAYLLSRLLILSTSPNLFFWEECERGTIGHEMLKGPVFEIFQYQWTPYEGGTLVVGSLIAVSYAIFGTNYIALKLVCLLFSAVTLLAAYLLLTKFFSPATASIASLLFILSPPYYTQGTLITLGSYVESGALSFVMMYLLFEILSGRRGGLAVSALFGLVCGFSVWFHYVNMVMIALCMICWLMFDRMFFLRRKFGAFLILLIIGISPWIYYNHLHGGENLSKLQFGILKVLSSQSSANSFWWMIEYILRRDIPSSLFYPDILGVSGGYVSYFYYATFIASLMSLLWAYRRRLPARLGNLLSPRKNQSPDRLDVQMFLAAYVLLYLAIYSFSDYHDIRADLPGLLSPQFAHKYTLPLYPFMFVCIAVFLGNLADSWPKYGRILAYLWLAAISIVWLNATIQLCFSYITVDNYNYEYYDVNEKYLPYCYSGYENRLLFYQPDSASLVLEPLDRNGCNNSAHREACGQFVLFHGFLVKNDIELLSYCRNNASEDVSACFRQFSAGVGFIRGEDTIESLKVCESMVPAYRCSCYSGIAERQILGRRLGLGKGIIPDETEIKDENLRKCFADEVNRLSGEALESPSLKMLCEKHFPPAFQMGCENYRA